MITKVFGDVWFEVCKKDLKPNKKSYGDVTINGRDYPIQAILEFARFVESERNK